MPNRLASQTSPYLLQHANNPVDWYPWGQEAFELARRENRPIFLSVGYSSCYWCHVMERQSFENEQIAAEMNRLFVNVKVDREERPDVDQIYMNAVQVMTRRGGWPMSLWLTPDLKPFYAGTYFPPADRQGHPGFLTICRGVAEAWKNRPQEVNDAAEELTGILRIIARPQAADADLTIDDAWIERMIERSTSDYDSEHGGFGSAPKFPRQTLLRLLLVHHRTFADAKRMAMLRHTLDALAAGGIRDQLGGAFHRYSTDARWLVPHFEIMLYDNAMLAWIYAEAFAQTKEPRYAEVARGVLDFLLREMRSPEGAFYTAFDAEVDAIEGASYLWTLDEVVDLLGDDDAEIFSRAYGLNEGANFADPHHGGPQPEKNVLFQSESTETIARSLNLEPRQIDQRLAAMRRKLYDVRRKRKQPALDNKILTSWNALAIGAFAHAAKILREPKYQQAAIAAAEFILGRQFSGVLDDDAFLIDALLELFHATGDERWRRQATTIASQMRQRFEDRQAGGFYFTAEGADDLIVRQKTASDSPLPSGNGVAARVLLELGQAAAAQSTLREFAGQMQANAESMSAVIEAAHLYLRSNSAFIVQPMDRVAKPASPAQLAMTVLQAAARWSGVDELIVSVEIQPGFHVSARTELRISGAEAIRIDYPPAQRLAMAGEMLDGYAGSFDIHVHFQHPPESRELVRLELAYQPCDDSVCLPAVRKAIEIAGEDNRSHAL